MLKNLKNAEYSKKLLVFIEVLIIAVFVLVCVSVCMGDSSPLTALITGTFTLASLSFGFYYWKAKNENKEPGYYASDYLGYPTDLTENDVRRYFPIPAFELELNPDLANARNQ